MRITELLIESLESEYVPRIQSAIDKRGISDQWENAAQKYQGESTAEKLLELFKDLDPTDRNNYTKWIATVWAKGNLPQEDAYKVTQYLKLYDQAKKANKLPPGAKDINRFKTIGDLYNSIKDLRQQEMKSGKQLKKEEVQKLFDNNEAEVTFNHPKYKIIKLKSENASCVLGRGTEWCTAATDSNNYFDDYNDQGDLYVIIFRGSQDKYQFFWPDEGDNILSNLEDVLNDRLDFEDGSEEEEFFEGMRAALDEHGAQFMDEHDQPVDIKKLIKEHPELLDYPKFEQVALLYSPGSVMALRDLPKHIVTTLIELDGKSIRYIDEPTRAQKQIAIKDSPDAIHYIEDLKPEDIYTFTQKWPTWLRHHYDTLDEKFDGDMKDIMMRVMKSGFTWPAQTHGRYMDRGSGAGKLLNDLLTINKVSEDDAKEVLKNNPTAYNRLPEGIQKQLKKWMSDYLSQSDSYQWDKKGERIEQKPMYPR